MSVGRKTQVIDCRETMGVGLGGELAQSGTISESESKEVIVLSMSPDRRHVTKPVCEITYGLREAGIEVSVIVLRSGMGQPKGSPSVGARGTICEVEYDEIFKIKRFKLAIIHGGAVKHHVAYKVRYLLGLINLPTIVICQAPIDFEDLAQIGIKTRVVRPSPEKIETVGEVVDIITDVIRGTSVPIIKMNEITTKVMEWIKYYSDKNLLKLADNA
ncbi:MAG: methyl-coenzyme M reductase I operon protein C [Candidatus Methylarchaceae archaeon HK01B]|nr:methyl-coenzyme M reductase I operon protein C [Candidatus Methylarchaceae archaeon HK02M1]MCP8318359.1 methyl-coenzyme M reductase I operon protein C [Candidatus Methylarchaceae archaeon HK01B]